VAGVELLVSALPQSLAKLTLSNNQLSAIPDVLTSVTSLTHLDLNFNQIGNEGATGLAEMLPFWPNLRDLSVLDNGITSEGMQALAPPLLDLNLERLRMNQAFDGTDETQLVVNWYQAAGMPLPPIQHVGLGIEALGEVRRAVARVTEERLRMLAFGSVTHARLGQQSPAHGLDAELVAMILHM
jgi:hypothetical protein